MKYVDIEYKHGQFKKHAIKCKITFFTSDTFFYFLVDFGVANNVKKGPNLCQGKSIQLIMNISISRQKK